MVLYKRSETEIELRQILDLQKQNMPHNLSKEQAASQGFVTVNHDLYMLQKMNSLEQNIIAKEGDSVIGYLLAMRPELRNDIPVLVPMFDVFDNLEYKNKKLGEFNYIVVGQVCVAERHRGKGILDAMYSEYKKQLAPKYDFAITEIDTKNTRSIKAHERIGFKHLHNYTSPDGKNWDIILWGWQK